MQRKLRALKESRRFWTAIGAAVTVAVGTLFGLPEAAVAEIVALAVAWIVSDSLRETS